MIRILNVEPAYYSPKARLILEQVGIVTEKEMTDEELTEVLGSYDVLIVRLGHSIDAKVLGCAPNLRAIVSATTGLDHIDVATAGSLGITVLSLKGEVTFLRSISATPEHTWALLLSLIRKIPQASRSVIEGKWDRDKYKGRELDGKTIGILGFGRVGSRIARYAQAFGMTVLAYDPYVDNGIEGVEQYDAMDEMLTKSDILSVHLPLNETTLGLIGAKELAMLPKGAIVINTARGGIVNEDALVSALEGGWIAGAALDVISNERNTPLRIHSRLMECASDHNNLLITPHIGGATYESMEKTEIFMAEKLVEFLKN